MDDNKEMEAIPNGRLLAKALSGSPSRPWMGMGAPCRGASAPHSHIGVRHTDGGVRCTATGEAMPVALVSSHKPCHIHGRISYFCNVLRNTCPFAHAIESPKQL